MRYIRTKNNRIIDTTKYYLENSNLFKNGAYQEYKKELANAYNQADTIEELCDDFLLENKITHWKCQMPYHRSVIHDETLQRDYIIYGAIWIKGEHGEPILKSVSQMNDKGEMELL